MRVLTRQAIKNIEEKLFNDGFSSLLLMENAKNSFIKNLDLNKEYFVVVCGLGNNGADGLSIARSLIDMGKDVDVFIFKSSSYNGLFKVQLDSLKTYDIKINVLDSEDSFNLLKDACLESDVVIDALFGIGLNKEINGDFLEVINIINDNSNYVVSVDVPSGIDVDTGKVLKKCVVANKTITFTAFKKGYLNYDIEEYLGEVIVESIGIPNKYLDEFDESISLIDESFVRDIFPKRRKSAYKGDFGKVLIVAGSSGFTGASKITMESCIKAGAGLVTVSSHRFLLKKSYLALKKQ